jgi:hypothetical protein
MFHILGFISYLLKLLYPRRTGWVWRAQYGGPHPPTPPTHSPNRLLSSRRICTTPISKTKSKVQSQSLKFKVKSTFYSPLHHRISEPLQVDRLQGSE